MNLRYPAAALKAIETGCRWLLPEDVEKAQKKVLSHLGQRGAARKKSLQKNQKKAAKALELKVLPSAQEKAAPAAAPVQLKLL
ncbi:MAG: hypothetical protein WAV21_00670 [Minisyncoccia bacterium]